jgi:glycosyltransferase involved in cell wall biosynthesis
MIRNVVFVVDNLSLPRCIKRIKAFYDKGLTVKVYGYNREEKLDNQLPPEIKPIMMGGLKDGRKYVSRAFKIRRDIRKIIKENKSDNSVFYSFGFVSSLFFSFSRVPFVYEIYDIRYGSYRRFSSFIGLFKVIDRFIIKKSMATVMTSGGFKSFIKTEKKEIFLIPNKITKALANYERHEIDNSKGNIRFGFAGSVRYQSTLKFAKVIGEYFPEYSFSIWGSMASHRIATELEIITEQYSNVTYYGPFRNPDDLPDIYSKLDAMVSSYDVNTLNERIAEPNKLYESLFFCRPIIVSNNTFLSEQVERYHCGFSIDATTEESIIKFVDNIKLKEIKDCSKAEYEIPVSELIDETDKIIDYIRNL